MSNQYENLVGPRPEDREETVLEDVTEGGQPLWMACLNDPEALSITKEEVEEAKNALAIAKDTNPEVISLCKHKKTPQECKDMIHTAQAA